MRHLSIAGSLRLALVGLTLALVLVAGLGVSSLYRSRQRYENVLLRTSALSTAAANRFALEVARPPANASSIRQAQARERAIQARLSAQVGAARARARTDSRRAMIVVIVAGLLALLGALSLIALLIGAMRRPLDELVEATRALSVGELDRRVKPTGPRELRDLGAAFNSMGADLAAAQAQVEEERRRLQVTIESLGDGLLVTRGEQLVLAMLNPRAHELMPELSAGQSANDEGSPLPPIEQALEREVTMEHRGRTLAITAAPLGRASEGVVWTLRDMSDRVKLEQAKSEFVATASHELRSPLTSIKGFIELLERSPENMSERQKEFVEIILRSTDRLVDLVNDLLDVARIEADRVEINSRPIDVGEAIREVVELMGPRLEEKRQQLGLYIAPTLPLATADPGRVRQIVANLLTNAHLYTPEGGRIHVGAEADRAWVQIIVADSGVGMSEEERARVFDRFYRGADGTRAAAGTGLGLSIVKSLVEMHDGQIDVESEPDRGTTFRVLLPAAVHGAESGRALEAVRGRRILVVDDEPEIAGLIAGQLAPLDVEADIATSGEQALQMLRGARYDAVTLDVLMPEMNGLDVLRQIRDDPELRMTPIVFVSVFSGRSELAGEWSVAKPIDADELRDVLGAAVRSGRSRVLVVGRQEMQPMLEPALDELGIEHQWEFSGPAAARVCGERRFEVALIDVGIRNPQAVLQALDLRGRRLRRAVILFSDGAAPAPPGIGRLGVEVVPVEQAAGALLASLRGDGQPQAR